MTKFQISRLVEKLKKKGLVERRSCEFDRRQVDVIITEEGLQLLAKASEAMDGQFEQSKSMLSEAEAAQLNNLLDAVRY